MSSGKRHKSDRPYLNSLSLSNSDTMNTHAINHLAQRLVKDPSFLSEAESLELRELLIDYTEGVLDDESKREVESLIQTSPTAAAIHAEFASTDNFLTTQEGKSLVARSKEETLAGLNDVIGISTKQSLPQTQSLRPRMPLRSKTSLGKDFWNQVKSMFALGDKVDLPAGYAFAQSEATEEFMPHLEGQVVTRLWKNEAGTTILWLITKNPDYIKLHYQFVSGPSGAALLKPKGNRFMEEIELGSSSTAFVHPEITRAATE